MKVLKAVITAAFASFLLVLPALGQVAALSPSDIKVLEGDEWTGSLTYTDYRSGKPISIKSNLRWTAEKDRRWIAEYSYPDEPKANSRSSIILSADGTLFNDQKVIALGSKGETLKVVTTKEGTDNDKPAVFRYTYHMSKNALSIRKDVKPEGSAAYFERNKYSWTRKPQIEK